MPKIRAVPLDRQYVFLLRCTSAMKAPQQQPIPPAHVFHAIDVAHRADGVVIDRGSGSALAFRCASGDFGASATTQQQAAGCRRQGGTTMKSASMTAIAVAWLTSAAAVSVTSAADMSFDRALNADREPQNWLL